jgi:hypothetical protein
VKAKLALFLSLILAVCLLADSIEVRGYLDDDLEEEAASIDALVISLRLKDSGRLHSRRITSNVPSLARNFFGRSENNRSSARIKKPSIFSQQGLYSFQQVYRL